VRAVVATLALGSALATSVWSAALPPASSATRASVSSTVPPGPFPKLATDTLGNPVTLRAPARRIVSIALSADEILIDLVAPERIVGITRFVDDPATSPASARAPRTAVRVTGEPEALLALRPDIVFASAYTRPEALSLMTGAGVPVIGSGAHAAEAGLRGPTSLTEEAAVALDPEIILVPVESEEAAKKRHDLLGSAPIWNAVGAARRGDVFGVPRMWLGSVSHYAVRGLEAVAAILDARKTGGSGT
jgi:ABC-type Fe3+-hydroxamate transport system substrate-binding protein